VNEVLIDVTRLVGRFMKGRLPTGVDRVSLEYVKHYRARSRAMVRLAGLCLVLPRSESIKLFQWLLAPTGSFRPVILIAIGLIRGLSRRGVAGSIFINAGHSGLEKEYYPDMLKRLQVKPLIVVHDLIPITHPEFCRQGEREKHIKRMNNVLSVASGIVAISQSTLNDLADFAISTGQTLPRSIVALLAPGISGISPGSRPIAGPYFVILSTIEPRKNHRMLLQLWGSFVERLGSDTPKLVIIGQRGWDIENVVELLEHSVHLKGYVYEYPSCSDADLVTYLHHAQALLFPSFVEGYGMPLVEALSHGVPVIASDLEVFREIADDIPEYLDPLDSKGWSDMVMEYAKSDSHLRNEQLKRIEHFKTPTWADHFAKVDALLEQVQ